MTTDPIDVFAALCHARRTLKVLAKEPWSEEHEIAGLDWMLSLAALAPYHKGCAKEWREGSDQNSLVPWRVHLLDAPGCRQLRKELLAADDRSKIPELLATADLLVQWNWLPNPKTVPSDALFEPTIENMEHIAAASAAIQQFLLAATAEGYETYWSSGGRLREPLWLERLGINAAEIVLGTLFLVRREKAAEGECIPGKLREAKGPITSWARRIGPLV